jgi:hypothetical protein
MSGELVETSAPAIERARTAAPSRVARAADAVPGLLVGMLLAAVGLAHGGYFPTAWGPLTIVLLAASAVALLVSPRPAVGARELVLPALLAGLTLWALASAAWGTPTEAVPEAQRSLTYAAGALAFALVLRAGRVQWLLTGVWAAICVVTLDALAGRLFPERFGEYDPIVAYRLSEPVGYWNALGALAAFGLVLGLGLAAHSTTLAVRLVAAASTVPVALTLYFTFSRGAWLALFAAMLLVLLLDPRRLDLASTLVLVGLWPAVAVVLASRSAPLTETGHSLSEASNDGHALAATAAGLALAAAAAAAFAYGVAPRVRLSVRASLVANVLLIAALAGSIAVVAAALGGPVEIARSFAAAPRATEGDLDERLWDLSGNGRVDHWRVALDQAGEHPLLGSGGGSYERHWLAARPYALNVRDAHSLFVEVLAEYGPLGLALVVALFAVPLGLAVRHRRTPLVPVAAGVVALYVVHASIDWDWEFPVLTLVALACAAAIVASASSRSEEAARGRRALSLVAVLAVLAVLAGLGAVGARAEAASADAFAAREYDRAVSEARRAESLVPWSVEPLLLLGRAQVAAGDREDARKTFRRAVERAPERWRLWYELAAVSRGDERRAALREARALNPRESLLDQLGGGR